MLSPPSACTTKPSFPSCHQPQQRRRITLQTTVSKQNHAHDDNRSGQIDKNHAALRLGTEDEKQQLRQVVAYQCVGDIDEKARGGKQRIWPADTAHDKPRRQIVGEQQTDEDIHPLYRVRRPRKPVYRADKQHGKQRIEHHRRLEISVELLYHVLSADTHVGSPREEKEGGKQLVDMPQTPVFKDKPQDAQHPYEVMAHALQHPAYKRRAQHHYHQVSQKPQRLVLREERRAVISRLKGEDSLRGVPESLQYRRQTEVQRHVVYIGED